MRGYWWFARALSPLWVVDYAGPFGAHLAVTLFSGLKTTRMVRYMAQDQQVWSLMSLSRYTRDLNPTGRLQQAAVLSPCSLQYGLSLFQLHPL